MLTGVFFRSSFRWSASAMVALWLISFPGLAAEAGLDLSAHDVVRSATEQVMAVVEDAREYAEKDPDRYYQAIDEILAPVIDYRGFARSVMGPYASGNRYRSLDEPGRSLLRDQLERFTDVMRSGLVATYGKGLLAFSGTRIELIDPSAEDGENTRVSVQQLIYAEKSKPYVLIYQMGLNKGKQWKLRNIIIESVNLGEIYKNQFQSAARKHNGDLDVVIESWSAAETKS